MNLESCKKTTDLALFVEEKSFLKDEEPYAESPYGSGRVRELVRIIDFSKGRISRCNFLDYFYFLDKARTTPVKEVLNL